MSVSRDRLIAQHAPKGAGAARISASPDVYTAGGEKTEAMVNFNAVKTSADGAVLPNRDKVARRADHFARNDGWIAGAIEKEVDGVIGANFRPLFKPDWKALGLSQEWASDFKAECSGLWRTHADDPRRYSDHARALPLPLQFALAYRQYCLAGEGVGVLGWDASRPVHTTLRNVDPDLLINPYGSPNSATYRDGVELNSSGAAVAYHFRVGHPADPYAAPGDHEVKRLERELKFGRPKVLHFFDVRRPGQTRGISRLAPIIETLKMENHYRRVELQAAVINAVLAAFIKSPMGPDAIEEMFGDGDAGTAVEYQAHRSSYYSDTNELSLGGAKIATLFPNDEIGVVNTARPASQFADFETAVLRQIASGLNISYEQLASDWSKTDYSSARAAMLEIWRSWIARRTSFAQGFSQLYLMAWLEERVDRKIIRLPSQAPDFHAHWVAYARSKWIGSGRGFVDPVKEVQAAAMKVALGLSTLEDEAAELTGSDFFDNMDQIKREISVMPESSLHPMQEKFAQLLGNVNQPVEIERGQE